MFLVNSSSCEDLNANAIFCSWRRLMWVVVAVRMLREELQFLQEPSAYADEVVKVTGIPEKKGWRAGDGYRRHEKSRNKARRLLSTCCTS